MTGPTWFLFLVAALYGVLAALLWTRGRRFRPASVFSACLGLSFLIVGLSQGR